ncbi:uncharacterized protein LOC135195894 [Macrobrachium nipponense]|uniref:uncharacterized protein LOC135195894 n=1 Tax=Macrobrachium nipponense TaxID=159736 RepID=UPI0030C7C2AA
MGHPAGKGEANKDWNEDEIGAEFNTTRVAELLAEIPELEAHKKGRSVLLALQKDVALALSRAYEYSDTLVIAKAAKILRKHILDHRYRLDGIFGEGCISDAIPQSLLQFTSIVKQSRHKVIAKVGSSKSDLAIAQHLQYN